MKLKNKKTGEIKDASEVLDMKDDNGIYYKYYSLAELNKEWEDYEPKEHWAIDQFGEPINVSGLSSLQLKKLRRLGNDFPSENATMKAIDKLKAWNRLGLVGYSYRIIDPLTLEPLAQIEEDEMVVPSQLEVEVHFKVKPNRIINSKDLDLLFCTEDN